MHQTRGFLSTRKCPNRLFMIAGPLKSFTLGPGQDVALCCDAALLWKLQNKASFIIYVSMEEKDMSASSKIKVTVVILPKGWQQHSSSNPPEDAALSQHKGQMPRRRMKKTKGKHDGERRTEKSFILRASCNWRLVEMVPSESKINQKPAERLKRRTETEDLDSGNPAVLQRRTNSRCRFNARVRCRRV